MSDNSHRRTSSLIQMTSQDDEDIEGQLDRLNQALQVMMNDIETTNISRNPSRLSVINSELFADNEQNNLTFHSEENFLPEGFEEKIEELLVCIDRNFMVIEDYRSEDMRRDSYRQACSDINQENINEKYSCGHDINRLSKEIWHQITLQKNEQNEKEKKKFEEKLENLDLLKEEYLKKRSELMSGFEKLKAKEELLEKKEKEIRAQRMAFDKHRLL